MKCMSIVSNVDYSVTLKTFNFVNLRVLSFGCVQVTSQFIFILACLLKLSWVYLKSKVWNSFTTWIILFFIVSFWKNSREILSNKVDNGKWSLGKFQIRFLFDSNLFGNFPLEDVYLTSQTVISSFRSQWTSCPAFKSLKKLN